MSVLLTCPHGHQWEPSTGVAPANGSSVCPECGAAAATPELPAVAGYEVLGEIGRGGVGVVYRARDVQHDRLVALKIIPFGEADRARFKTEAEAIAKLHHANIAEIYEVGESNRRPFVAREFVNGGSLADKLDGAPWRPRQAAGLVETLARALHVAHQAGVVHRDLKPANVLMTMDGLPKIVDFGALGTPGVLAPELVGAKPNEVGPAADVYALGAIFYEMLTGKPPFPADAPLDAALQMMGDGPAPPRQVHPKVPLDFETICLKCLRKEPARRYATAEALAQDLARCLDGNRIAARPERGRRRTTARALLTTIVLLLLAAVVGAVCWFAAAAHDEPSLRAEALNARRHHYNAQMGRIQLAWEENARDAVPDLLDDLLPNHTGGADLRGFEWYFWKHRKPHENEGAYAVFRGGPTFAISPDGTRLATAGLSGDVTVWDVAGRQEVRTIHWKDERPPPAPVLAVMIPAGPGGPPKPPPVGQPSPPSAEERRTLICSPDGTRLLGWTPRGPVHVWDVADGRELFSLQDESPHKGAGGFRVVEYSPDAKTLLYACTGLDGWIGAWDAETGRAEPTQDVSGLAVEVVGQAKTAAAAFSPDRQRIALPLQQRPLEVWDAAKGSRLFSTDAASDFAAYSPDGRLIAGGDRESQTVVVWDAQTGKRVATLREYPSAAVSASFSPDGRRLAAVSADGVRVWDLDTMNEVLSSKELTSVQFSADKRFLAAGAPDGTIQVWKVGPGD